MTRKAKNYIFLFVLLLALSGIAIGYYFYNKGPVDVKDSNAISIQAGALYDTYDKDSLAAQKKYTGKILAVTGEVNEIAVNQQQKKIVQLKTSAGGAFINCTMEEDIENIQVNDRVNIKGICSGIGAGDADLGIKGDVYLTRCYLLR